MVVLMAVFTASASAALPANGTFEGSGSGSLANWKGTNAALSLVAGHDGNWAARASLSAAATSYSLVASPRPVASTVKDAVYSSTAWVRSRPREVGAPQAGRVQLVREHGRSGPELPDHHGRLAAVPNGAVHRGRGR